MTALLERRRASKASGRHCAPDAEPGASPAGPDGPRATTPGSGHGADLDRFDGRRRRRQALVVVGLAALTGVGGVAIGSRVRSPADEAASRAAPAASRITVPVARQRLESSLTLSAEVRYSEPFAVTLAGPVGTASDDAQVVTRVPDAGTPLAEGDAPFEVSGRPVIFLQGDLPMYRGLAIDSDGPDVAQLETALDRLGYDTGTVDSRFDRATADALTALYATLGSTPQGPTPEESEALRLARDGVTAAEQAVRDADAALAEGSGGRPASELLQLRQTLDAAQAAVPVTQQSAANDETAARSEIVMATASRDAATVTRDEAAAERDAAARTGALDPETGAVFTAARLTELAAIAAQADQDLVAADAALIAATNALPVIRANGSASVTAATDAVALAEVQLAEATEPADTSALSENADAAREALDRARADLSAARAAAGPRVSPGDFMFVPLLPSTVTEVWTTLGSPIDGRLATVSTADTALRAPVSAVDADVVHVGDEVVIEIRDLSVTVPGSVVSIGVPAAEPSSGDPGGGSEGEAGAGAGDSSGRLEVTVVADDPTALLDYVDLSAKLRIAVASTDDDVLVVPVAALTVGPDGTSRIEVERSPVTADGPGETVPIAVRTGLGAGGLVEIEPIDATLDEGDRVVVGTQDAGGADGDDVADDDVAD